MPFDGYSFAVEYRFLDYLWDSEISTLWGIDDNFVTCRIQEIWIFFQCGKDYLFV